MLSYVKMMIEEKAYQYNSCSAMSGKRYFNKPRITSSPLDQRIREEQQHSQQLNVLLKSCLEPIKQYNIQCLEQKAVDLEHTDKQGWESFDVFSWLQQQINHQLNQQQVHQPSNQSNNSAPYVPMILSEDLIDFIRYFAYKPSFEEFHSDRQMNTQRPVLNLNRADISSEEDNDPEQQYRNKKIFNSTPTHKKGQQQVNDQATDSSTNQLKSKEQATNRFFNQRSKSTASSDTVRPAAPTNGADAKWIEDITRQYRLQQSCPVGYHLRSAYVDRKGRRFEPKYVRNKGSTNSSRSSRNINNISRDDELSGSSSSDTDAITSSPLRNTSFSQPSHSLDSGSASTWYST